MIALPVLLLVTGASDAPPLPPIVIDPCVEVDAEEVRRLAALELSNWAGGSSSLEVVVACDAGLQEIRLNDRARGEVAARSIDLNAPSGTDRDAKARELALAIAELLRRAAAEPTPEPAPPPPAPPPKPAPGASTEKGPAPARVPEDGPFRLEVGVTGVAAHFTGGETLLGVNMGGRVRLGRWLIAETYLGGRRTRPLDLKSGKLDGHGLAAGVGLAVDTMPGYRAFGLSLGARLGGEWLRYAAVDSQGEVYGGGDGGVVTITGVARGFATLSRPVCLIAEISAGAPLHSIAVEENGRALSAMNGAVFAGALGVAAQF